MAKQMITLPDGQVIFYRLEHADANDQQCIVFVHGNFSAHGWWDETIKGLSDVNKKIIAIDMKGFGDSSYIHKANRFKDFAQNVIDTLNALKIKKSILIGWSFGGAVCQKVCQMAPELVSKLILTCSVSHEGLEFKNNEGKICKTQQELATIPKIAGSLAIIKSKNKEAMRNVYDLVLFQKMLGTSQQRKNNLVQDSFKQRNYLQLCEALANSDINIEAIKTPTLIIHGTQDLVLPLQTIMGTANKLGIMDLWEGHGHMIPIQDTQRYVKALKKFIC